MFFFRLFIICGARVSAFVIVLNDSPYEGIAKMGDLSDFERRQIVGARLAGASVIQTVTLLGTSSGTVCKIVSAYTNHGKTISEKRNSGRKSALTERERRTLRRIVSKNYRTTAAHVRGQQTE
jgi:transposase